MLKLSVVIIAFNSEKTIADAVKSALFADEILILDSGSDDKTVDIVKNLGARVEYQKWLGFGMQKQRAVDLAEFGKSIWRILPVRHWYTSLMLSLFQSLLRQRAVFIVS